MCKRCGESVDNLLLHCSISYEMWSMIFCLFGICWVMPKRVVDLLDCWTCNFSRHRNIVIWRFVRIIWCGVSCENGILEALRVVNGPLLSLSLSSFLLYLNDVLFYHLFLVCPFLCCLIIVIWFLDVFAFLYISYVLGCVFLIKFLCYLSKKKWAYIQKLAKLRWTHEVSK